MTAIRDIQSDLDRADACVDGYRMLSREYCGEWAGAKLRKLPLWGVEQVDDEEIDFEWPTQEMFANMNPNERLHSLEFKTRERDGLGSVKVNLANGESSEALEKQGVTGYYSEFWNEEKISFKPDNSIREVGACTGPSSISIQLLRFYDSTGNKVYEYNPYNSECGERRVPEEIRHEIADNEELIGVYGVKEKKNWLSNFGFIVKTKSEE